jgi:hypothetical protein
MLIMAANGAEDRPTGLVAQKVPLTPIRERNAAVKLLVQKVIQSDLVEDWRDYLANADEHVDVEINNVGPQGIIEWLLPAVIIIAAVPATSSFLSGFFTRLGERSADAGVDGLKALFRRTCAADRRWWKTDGRGGCVEAGKAPPLAIVVVRTYQTGVNASCQLTMRFIFRDSTDQIEWQQALDSAAKRMKIAEDVLDATTKDIARLADVAGDHEKADRKEAVMKIAVSRLAAECRCLSGVSYTIL